MKKVPHYWKWAAWTQPVFSGSNTASDGSVISSDSIRPDSNDYGAMDGIKSGSGERHTWKSDNTNNCYWKVVFPYEIKITGLTHYNARNKDNLYRNVQGRFYADEAMSTPIGDAISTPVTSWYQTPIANIPSEGIITDTIYFRKTGGDPVSGIGELEITATKLVESSAEDYDFIEYDLKPAIFMRKIPHYWKWAAWTQPVFSGSNIASDGSETSGYGTYRGSAPYGAMDGVKSGGDVANTTWEANATSGHWWKVKFPYKIKITGLLHYNRYGSGTTAIVTGRFYADDLMSIPIGDQFTSPRNPWSQTQVENIPAEGIVTDTIKFYKSGGDTHAGIGELDITATKLVEGSAEDYDFIEWSTTCRAFVERVPHYFKWNPWEQPVLTSNTSYGVVTCSAESTTAGQKAFNASDGVKSGTAYSHWVSDASTGWWQWKLPVKLKITKIVFYNRYRDNLNITGRFYTDSSKTIPIGNSFSPAATSWAAVTVYDNAEGIITDTIYFDKTAGSQYNGIGELEITATVLEEGTAEDYDYMEYSL